MTQEELEAQALKSENDKTLTNDEEDKDDVDYETLMFQKKHFREKAEKAKVLAEQLAKDKADLEARLAETTKTKDEEKLSLVDKIELIELRQSQPDISNDDLDELKGIAKSKGLSLAEAFKTPIFSSYMRVKEIDSRKDVPTDNRSPKRHEDDWFDAQMVKKFSDSLPKGYSVKK